MKMRKTLPKCWSDCSRNQILKALPVVLTVKANEDSAATLRLMDHLAEILSGITKVSSLPLLARQDLYSSLAWAISEPLKEKPYPFIRVGHRRYYLPEPTYADSSTIEVAMANIQYLAFSNPRAPNPEALFEFLGTILRPRRMGWRIRQWLPSYNGENREVFNSLRAQKRAKRFRKLNFQQIIPVLLYWQEMNNAFIRRYEKLYESDESTRQLFQNGEGWLSTIEDVAENRVHGNFDAVCETNIHTIWLYLSHKKVKTDEANRLMQAE
ncbi:hypothetical protein [Arundinibacter roseus]|uniref:Uncharacterized protein n=1 Tax=Arundinibacter roseus TaxID=2070510 RepID=A0A4R4KGJ2_9BACT|nr:hypothetical protein [Arundinibacter roseus]TDB66803.1 hypothetical protein EZE20_06670 [Arundinibacter roseus]